MDWDVLFLIPAPWSSPVLAPVLVSLALVGSSTLLLQRLDVAGGRGFRARDWLVQIVAGALIVASMLWNAEVVDRQETPVAFPWWLFLLGAVGRGGSSCARCKQAR
jgi:hypothetical protein